MPGSTPLARATDEELMRRVQADDTVAFAMLYDRLGPRALGLAAVVCADRDHARDVVQESFAAIWRARASYRADRGAVTAWALTIVRHRALDDVRRGRPHDLKRHGHDEARMEALPARDDIEAGAVAGDDAQQLRVLLAELPVAQREVIALAFFGQLSHSEIAQRLALPLGTVKGRMRLGMRKLRRRFPS